MPSGHRLKAVRHHERSRVFRHEYQRKGHRIYEHYGEALAVDANGQLLSVMKMVSGRCCRHRTLPGMWRAVSASARAVLLREGGLRGGTLKLIIPQQEAPSRRLIGFRTACSTRRTARSTRTVRHTGSHPVRCGFHPAGGRGNAGNPAPAFWRWLDRAAGGRAEKRE